MRESLGSDSEDERWAMNDAPPGPKIAQAKLPITTSPESLQPATEVRTAYAASPTRSEAEGEGSQSFPNNAPLALAANRHAPKRQNPQQNRLPSPKNSLTDTSHKG
jgi:hypothetical protein